jgi:IMP cyclohydrolase
MNNPNAPYPGRQLFLGLTGENNPCFAYLITGRSPESRERKAVLVENTIRIGPLGNQPYDPLRHYSAVKYNPSSGVAAVSNGIQTEAIFETYQLLYNTASYPSTDYLQKIMEGAGAEPDSYHTPRIAGLITEPPEKGGKNVFVIGIKAYTLPARAALISPQPGKMVGVSTYKGLLDSPEARNPADLFSELEFRGREPEELAVYLFEMSAASYKGNDIRVCTVGGIRNAQKGWRLAIKNVH